MSENYWRGRVDGVPDLVQEVQEYVTRSDNASPGSTTYYDHVGEVVIKIWFEFEIAFSRVWLVKAKALTMSQHDAIAWFSKRSRVEIVRDMKEERITPWFMTFDNNLNHLYDIADNLKIWVDPNQKRFDTLPDPPVRF